MQKIGQQVAFTISHEMLDRVDALAKRAKVSRAEMLRTCVSVGVDLGEGFVNIGAFKIHEMASKGRKIVQEACSLQMNLFRR